MKKHFVFCHGFSFDKYFWKNLAPYFAEENCTYLDLGYFEEESKLELEEDIELIGIGHSLGLLKLLGLNRKFNYLIGLNSFVNFLGNNEELRMHRTQELQILKENFLSSKIATLRNFYKKCGIPSIKIQKIEQINVQKALDDLAFLSNTGPISVDTPMLIIGSKDDIIVPPEILYDNFKNYHNVTLEIMDDGMHGLGFLKTDIIYKKIIKGIQNAY